MFSETIYKYYKEKLYRTQKEIVCPNFSELSVHPPVLSDQHSGDISLPQPDFSNIPRNPTHCDSKFSLHAPLQRRAPIPDRDNWFHTYTRDNTTLFLFSPFLVQVLDYSLHMEQLHTAYIDSTSLHATTLKCF